jgi:hypothetical protein
MAVAGFLGAAPFAGRNIRETGDMRLLLGIIIGVFLTIGVAYFSDASIPTRDTTVQTTTGSGQTTVTTAEQRPMVNWDVVSKNWQGFTLGVRNTWHKIASR